MSSSSTGVHNFVLGEDPLSGYAGRVSSTIAALPIKNRSRWQAPPRIVEVLALALIGSALFVVTILHFRGYRSAVLGFGDSGAYISIANAIRHWDFAGLHEKQFWGYSYAVAGFSMLTQIPVTDSLVVVSILASLVSVCLAYNLCGGRVAALFAVSNFEWLQRSVLGGSEPLFVLLLFASFWATRRERWILASCLAACATVTRPVGLLVLAAIGLVLIAKKRYRELAYCSAVSLALGGLYILPFWLYFGDPLYQFHRYQSADWHSGPAITWPFRAIAQSMVHNQQPWTNLLYTSLWIAVVAVGLVAILCKKPKLTDERAIEWFFAVFYIAFLLSYNSAQWSRAEFPRFSIPVLPFVYLALSRWIPEDRRLVWALGIVSSILAAASALGLRNVLAMLSG